MPHLIEPDVRLHTSFAAAHREWAGAHQDGHGLRPGDDVESATGFATWVDGLRKQADTSIPPVEGWVHCSYWWIVEDDQFLGSIALRHTLNELLAEIGGHIGYGVRPTARGRGLAGWALAGTLDQAWALGLDRVLITCDPGNTASARTIEKNGGVPEDIRTHEGRSYQRYWIARR